MWAYSKRVTNMETPVLKSKPYTIIKNNKILKHMMLWLWQCICGGYKKQLEPLKLVRNRSAMLCFAEVKDLE